jgi:quinoprotein dehydrogenase-associated probable ABC transporter substrate-binding protein
MRLSVVLTALAALAFVIPVGARGEDSSEDLSIELVDQHAFRACADPRNMPFSDEAREGFENKIAELFARKLGRPAAYSFYPGATGFIRNTLNAHRCDVVLGFPLGDDLVQPTNPYYRTAYAAVYRKDGPLAGLEALSDPRLTNVRIGVIAGTPPATYLAMDGLLGHIKSYQLVVDTRLDAPVQDMMRDLDNGDIDIALLWGPMAGYYAQHVKTPVVVEPLVREKGGPQLVYRIVMGVRHSDQNWKRELNKLIAENHGEIDAILRSYGVPLLDETDKPLAAP